MQKILLILLLLPVFAQGQIITTIAGGGTGGLGDGGPATAAIVSNPGGVVFGKDSSLYVTTQTRIRKIDRYGIISTIAGTGVAGYGGDGGPATAAKLNWADGITVDTFGNILFSDFFNFAIRKIDIATGVITTICGNGIQAYTGDNGPASSAQLYSPESIFFDKRTGNLYVAENGAQVIRKISPSGIITTVAGTGVLGFNGDGLNATATQLDYPEDVAVDSSGNIYISDGGNNRIRKINASGIVSTIAGNGSTVYGGSGGPATSAQLVPQCFAQDLMHNMFISGSEHVSKIDISGTFNNVAGTGVHGYAGDGGPATLAQLDHIHGIAIDPYGNLLIADGANNRVRKVTFNPSTLETNQLNLSSEPSIYPNPATMSLIVSCSVEINTLAISNLLGQTVYSHEYGSQQIRIDVASLPAGVYLIRINGTEVRRFVKD